MAECKLGWAALFFILVPLSSAGGFHQDTHNKNMQFTKCRKDISRFVKKREGSPGHLGHLICTGGQQYDTVWLARPRGYDAYGRSRWRCEICNQQHVTRLLPKEFANVKRSKNSGWNISVCVADYTETNRRNNSHVGSGLGAGESYKGKYTKNVSKSNFQQE